MTEHRLPRFQRAKRPPPMIMTPRDVAVVSAVHQFGVLDRSQIERLLFRPDGGQDHPTKTSRCRLRLKLLYHHGYLARLVSGVQPGKGHGDYIYCLDRKGAQLIARTTGVDPNWRPKDKVRTPFFLEHTLKLNDFRIAVTLGAQQHGYALAQWVDEREFRVMKERVVDLSDGSEVLPFMPDGFFVLNVEEHRACFFVEIDRGTMTVSRFGTKVRAYISFRQSGQAVNVFQTKYFRVLTVTTGEKRLTSLRQATEKADGKDHFWFTTLDQITADKVLCEPIWQVASEVGRRPLVEGS